MKSKKKRPYLGFLKEYAFKKKLLPYYILTIAIIVLTAGVSLVRPELQGKVIDDLGNPHGTSLSAFMLLLAVFLGMLLLNYLMNYVQRYVVAVISEEIAADMRQKVEDKLSTVSVNFFEKIKLSDILLKVDKDVSAVKQCGITSIITLISNIVILVVVPPYMFSIHKGIAVSNIILLVLYSKKDKFVFIHRKSAKEIRDHYWRKKFKFVWRRKTKTFYIKGII